LNKTYLRISCCQEIPYEVNKLLGRHVSFLGEAFISRNYPYHDNTQAENVELIGDQIMQNVFWRQVSPA
jgi:hypothetical protein